MKNKKSWTGVWTQCQLSTLKQHWNDRQHCHLQAHLENPPKVRVYQNDQLTDFKEMDEITKFDDITQSQALANYLFHKTLECIVFYNLVFCATTGFPKIFGAIKVDQDLHVKLECCWFGVSWMAFLKIAAVNHKFNWHLETLLWLICGSVFNTIIFWVLLAGLCK